LKEKRAYHDSAPDDGFGFSRRQKVLSVYVQATGSLVQVFDGDSQPVETDGDASVERDVCGYCNANGKGGGNCRQMHAAKIRESGSQGSPQIYRCRLGLMFWVSPIYSAGAFSGALCASGYVCPEAGGYESFCTGEIPPEEFSRRISAFPVGDTEKIRSLAEMLLLCSESLSSGNDNRHEKLRLRHEQQASLSSLVDELKEQYPEGGSDVLGYPIEKERNLLTVLRQGDKKEAERILNEILAVLVFTNRDQFHYIQVRGLELAVLLTRSGTNTTSATAVETNARYLRQIQGSKTIEELTGVLHGIVEEVAEQVTSFQGLPHASAMRKAELFIRENLTRKISLGEIAKVAGLSAPYFSTIFKEEMGENLSSYVNRQRVEKASKLLLETSLTLSEIAASCCFQDQSWFSKIFKSFTGISPGKYRRQGGPISVLQSNVSQT